jgi:type IV secretory pathway TrbD component
MWTFLAALVALQIYFVRELLAALLLFAIGFVILGGIALVVYLVNQAGQHSLAWVEPRTRFVTETARRGWVALEELSKKPFRRPRSEPAP